VRRRLFINADDFGLTQGVTEGIAAALEAGVVGGTTAMVCVPEAVARIRRYGLPLAGRVGLHLQLTGGTPCLPPGEIPSLVGGDGRFPRKKVAVVDVNPEEVCREWQAQLARFLETGLRPSHLDTHHHIHKRPEVFGVFLEMARELGLPARALSDDMRRDMDTAGVAHADVCVTRFFGEELTVPGLLSLVDAAFAALGGAGTVEIMCHPGRCDDALAAISTYAFAREEELAILCAPGLADALAGRGVSLIGPAQVLGEAV
jgi:predicted glycoside hydrolase/deacetylase ChbG (UPF0249 family)